MTFQIEPINLAIGAGIAFITWLVIYFIFNRNTKNKTKTSLPQIKKLSIEAHNSCVDAANNMIKLIEVFNEIEEEKK